MNRLNEISTLARKMMLNSKQAAALPAVLEHASGSVGMSEADLISRCMADTAVAGYLASVCREVAK